MQYTIAQKALLERVFEKISSAVSGRQEPSPPMASKSLGLPSVEVSASRLSVQQEAFTARTDGTPRTPDSTEELAAAASFFASLPWDIRLSGDRSSRRPESQATLAPALSQQDEPAEDHLPKQQDGEGRAISAPAESSFSSIPWQAGDARRTQRSAGHPEEPGDLPSTTASQFLGVAVDWSGSTPKGEQVNTSNPGVANDFDSQDTLRPDAPASMFFQQIAWGSPNGERIQVRPDGKAAGDVDGTVDTTLSVSSYFSDLDWEQAKTSHNVANTSAPSRSPDAAIQLENGRELAEAERFPSTASAAGVLQKLPWSRDTIEGKTPMENPRARDLLSRIQWSRADAKEASIDISADEFSSIATRSALQAARQPRQRRTIA